MLKKKLCTRIHNDNTNRTGGENRFPAVVMQLLSLWQENPVNSRWKIDDVRSWGKKTIYSVNELDNHGTSLIGKTTESDLIKDCTNGCKKSSQCSSNFMQQSTAVLLHSDDIYLATFRSRLVENDDRHDFIRDYSYLKLRCACRIWELTVINQIDKRDKNTKIWSVHMITFVASTTCQVSYRAVGWEMHLQACV